MRYAHWFAGLGLSLMGCANLDPMDETGSVSEAVTGQGWVTSDNNEIKINDPAAQQNGTVAVGVNRSLTVWEAGSAVIMGSLSDANGKPVGSPFVLAQGGLHPSVAVAGDVFLVAWQDKRLLGGYRDHIYAKTINEQGGVGGDIAIALNDQNWISGINWNGPKDHPSVASDGNQFLVAYESGAAPARALMAVRVGKSGNVIIPKSFDGTPFMGKGPLSPRFDITAPSCTSSKPDEFVCVTHVEETQGVGINKKVVTSIVAVSSNGFILSTGLALDSGGPRDCKMDSQKVAADGQNYLAVWRRQVSPTISQVYATRMVPFYKPGFIGLAGVKARSVFGVYAKYNSGQVPNITVQYSSPSVTFDGSNYIVAFVNGSNLVGGRVNTGINWNAAPAALTDPELFAISSKGETAPAIASAGNGKSLVVYQRTVAGQPRLFGRIITPL